MTTPARKPATKRRIREPPPYIMVRFGTEAEKAAVERAAKRAGYEHAATYLRDLATRGAKKK